MYQNEKFYSIGVIRLTSHYLDITKAHNSQIQLHIHCYICILISLIYWTQFFTKIQAFKHFNTELIEYICPWINLKEEKKWYLLRVTFEGYMTPT